MRRICEALWGEGLSSIVLMIGAALSGYGKLMKPHVPSYMHPTFSFGTSWDLCVLCMIAALYDIFTVYTL